MERKRDSNHTAGANAQKAPGEIKHQLSIAVPQQKSQGEFECCITFLILHFTEPSQHECLPYGESILFVMAFRSFVLFVFQKSAWEPGSHSSLSRDSPNKNACLVALCGTLLQLGMENGTSMERCNHLACLAALYLKGDKNNLTRVWKWLRMVWSVQMSKRNWGHEQRGKCMNITGSQ